MVKSIVCLAAVLAMAGSARGQDNQLAEAKVALERSMVAARVPLETITTGAPYSAQTLMQATQALADGNRISRKTTGRVYRDGSGRVRREEDRQDGSVAISIVDPVAGASYVLDPDTRIAWKTPTSAVVALMKSAADNAQQQGQLERAMTDRTRTIGRSGAAAPGLALIARDGLEKTPRGPLEQRTIDGIAVEGRAGSKTIPAGEIGNERPITIVNEEWRSPELKVLVMTRYSDPRTGESSYHLTDIVRGEPDATLFVVPAGYEIRETGVRREQK